MRLASPLGCEPAPAAPIDDPVAIRRADPALLAAALVASRARTLTWLAAFERALGAGAMTVPLSDEVNPPLWEMGHIAWFQEYWIARNPECGRGVDAAADAPRLPSLRADADRHYDSSRVAHDTRWRLPLADRTATRDFLDRTLDRNLRIVADWRPAADPLRAPVYFAWLALMHEDMHGEAAVYMANNLSIALDAGRPHARAGGAGDPGASAIAIVAGRHDIGAGADACAFDNEMPQQRAEVAAFEIDAAPVSNAAFAAFVDAGGYAQRRYWTAAGWEWRERHGASAPRFWRRSGSGWEQRWYGAWEPLAASAPVCNLSAHEADAWCRWAGRRLPGEREWEVAAQRHGDGKDPGRFAWGEVWEWTADAFEPYPGFVAHPYRDYSQPWFGSRRCLRGASFATEARLRDPRYRNFFPAGRNDIFAGFRSCAPRD